MKDQISALLKNVTPGAVTITTLVVAPVLVAVLILACTSTVDPIVISASARIVTPEAVSIMTVDQRTEPLEQELLLEETKEGHASQLKRTRASYRKKNCNDQAIFEYAWTLTRSPSSKKSLQGIRVLKALTFQNPEFAGYGYLAIAQAYLRLGNYQKCRQHAHMLMQAYPKADPERNSGINSYGASVLKR